jgi:hypothetical protein
MSAEDIIRRHSQPWKANEYLYVDGIPCTYTVAPAGVVVHFPGRASVMLTVLKSSRRHLTLPVCWRMESYA